MTKILVDVDDQALAQAAARLGTRTKKATIGRALELAARDTAVDETTTRDWDNWADSVGGRVSEIDWREAWR